MMEIENPNFVINHHKSRYLILIAGVVTILMVALLDFFNEKRLGLSRETYFITSVVIFVLINAYRFIKDYYYIHISIEKEKLILKHYSLKAFAGKRKSIEIPLSTFLKYEIQNKKLGLVPYLILYQKVKGKAAKYPPISLSAFTKDEIKNIRLLLNNIKPPKN